MLNGFDACLIIFDDVRDAEKAFDVCSDSISGVEVSFLDPKAATRVQGYPDGNINNFEGQLIGYMTGAGLSFPFSNSGLIGLLESAVQSLLSVEIKVCVLLPNEDPGRRAFRVEFFLSSATADVLEISPIRSQDFHIVFDDYPGGLQLGGMITPSSSPSRDHQANGYHGVYNNRPSLTGRSMYDARKSPRRGPGAFDYGTPSDVFGIQPHARNEREHSIDIYSIQLGTDVRTTIMLRNIPNRMNCHELKELVDVTSRGRYDFMYLRIDFANKCNVGYAFINFATPEDIIPFAMARQNRYWGIYGSPKCAQISYASKCRPSQTLLLLTSFSHSRSREPHPEVSQLLCDV